MGQGSSRPEERRPSRLHRAQTTITESIPSIFSRRSSQHAASNPRRTRPSSIAAFSQLARTRTRRRSNTRDDTHRYTLPNVNVPALGLDFQDVAVPAAVQSRALDTGSRRPERRASSFISDRMSALRPHRRRRSPHRREEDQAAMLSEILAAAAAATAASLMGEDPHGTSDPRNFGGGDEDGTFDSFLQALQNGRIASALRGENVNDADTGGMPAPLNFFRMFRFGSNNTNRRIERQEETDTAGENDGDGRMVPIIIVGIRSINPSNGGSQDENIPPFLEALSAFPSPLVTQGQGERETAVDGILRQSTAPTARFSHRRRASMGGFPANYDSQRHHPRPPPSTPSSVPLSAISSGATTPTMSPATAASSATPSRRESFTRRPPASGLETTSEEPTTQRSPRQRRLSESDFATRFGSGSSRRNGVVEPDHNPGEGSRSWIIYVLGGSYSENHPIFTTPSLFTDSPTYEDMLLLSALLGPAKPPVASEADVAAASGLYRITMTEERGLVAEAITLPIESTEDVAVEADSAAEPGDITEPLAQPKPIVIAPDQRCLVCLGEYEAGEEARQLIKCEHLFHKECIDHWLLNGRNSCPLCRRQGVGDEEQADQSEAESETAPDGPPVPTSDNAQVTPQTTAVS